MSALPSSTALPRPPAVAPLAPVLRPVRQESRGLGRGLTAGVLGLHVLAGWAVLQLEPVRQAVVSAAPIMVSLIAPAEQPKPLPPPPQPSPQPVVKPKSTPLIAAAPTPSPAPVAFVAPAPEPAPVAVALPAPAAPPAPPAPPVAAPAQPKTIPASALRYVVEPPIEMPLLSRRAREQGRVMLRVVVDAQGRPKDVMVHKSSGFARLDEQAVWAMRQARFKPYMENGQAIEAAALAPFDYEL
jgi:protein TonB